MPETDIQKYEFLLWQPSIIQSCRVMPTTLQNLNDGCGFSGTDASMLEVANGLATLGHGVRVLSGGPADREGPAGKQVGSVRYLSHHKTFLDRREQVASLAQVDVLIVEYILGEAHSEMIDIINRLTKPSLKVILWCHSIHSKGNLSVLENVCSRKSVPFMLVGVSEFVRHHTVVRRGRSVTVGNALNPAIFRRTDQVREQLSMIFCASYERGGRIAKLVHEQLQKTLPMGQLFIASYCDSKLGPSLSKRALADRMRMTDYMVYPLVLDSGSVHHDTYACVILEAMASGVLVVTWDVACLRGVYGDMITLVPPPAFDGYDPAAEFGKNNAMLEPAAITSLAEAVTCLVNLPKDERESRRERARSWALGQTWDKRVTSLISAVRSMDTLHGGDKASII